MVDEAGRVRPETLLAHAGWLRGLARHLVLDPAVADDVVQDTWLAALEHPPREPSGARAWLGAVARNVVRSRGRSERRRREREGQASGPSVMPDPAETVERLDLHRRLVEHVRALDEPERTTVLLRYFEGMRPNEIAARTEIPASTVRTRLKRALDRLRVRLDASHDGDRRAWGLMLLPLAGLEALPSSSSAASFSLGGLIMSAKVKVVAIVGVLVLTAVVVWRVVGTSGTIPEEEPTPRPDVAAAVRDVTDVRGGDEEKPEARQPENADAAGDATEETVTPPPPTRRGRSVSPPPPTGIVEGRVACATGGSPLEIEILLKRVRQRGDPPGIPLEFPATIDAAGRFRVEGLRPGSYWLHATHPVLAPHRQSIYLREDRGVGPLEITLHPGGTLIVRVLDERGGPIANQQVNYTGPAWDHGKTDEEGAFRQGRLPPGNYKVRWFAEGTEALRCVTITSGKTTEVVFGHETAVFGVAYGPDGATLHNSIVRLTPLTEGGGGYRAHSSPTDEKGRYEAKGLASGRFRVGIQVLAKPGRPGYTCVVCEVVLVEGRRREMDLRVGPTAIRGRVTRKDDGTPLTSFPQQVQITARRALLEGVDVLEQPPSVMAFADADGRFEFPGLEPGTYQIWIDPFVRGLRRATRTVEVPAVGLENVDFALEARSRGVLKLRVVDPDGDLVGDLHFSLVTKSGEHTTYRPLHPASRGPGGTYTFALDEGERRVAAHREGYRSNPEIVVVTITKDEPVVAEVKLSRQGAVLLTVREPTGIPAVEIHVRAARDGGKARGVQAKPKGEGVFLVWLDPGKTTLRVGTAAGTADPVTVTVEAGKTLERTLTLRAR